MNLAQLKNLFSELRFFTICVISFSFLILCPASNATVIPIGSIEELQKIGTEYPLDGEYELSHDIDASDTVNWNNGAGFQPIGTLSNPFAGKFNGNGYKISYLYINLPDNIYVGIFGCIGPESEISNLIIESSWIVGQDYVGGVVGRNLGGTIRNSVVRIGLVYGRYDIGGITGANDGLLIFCNSANSVIGSSRVGNLVGNNQGNVSYCYAVGKVSGTSDLGGLIGYNFGAVENCYSRSAVVGGDYVGGLIGSNYASVSISYCYSTGVVSGVRIVGGLIGVNGGAPVSKSYWDKESSKVFSSAGGEGKTTVEMKRRETYENWDFTSTWAIVEEIEYPYLRALGPTLIPSPPEKNISSLEELDKIGRDAEYPWNGTYHLTNDIDASETLHWDGGKGFQPIKNFFGELYGHGYVIRGLYINRSNENRIGLFGSVGASVLLKDIGLENVSIIGAYKVGGLIGEMIGGDRSKIDIDNCYSTGFVTGLNFVGGLIGYEKYGTINNSYSYCSVSGENYVGGLVGYVDRGMLNKNYFNGSVFSSAWYSGGIVGYLYYGNVENTFAIGDIGGVEKVGGVVGKNYNGQIYYSYSIAQVTGSSNVGGLIGLNESGTIGNCYWDVEVSGVNWSDGGIGKLTAEMKWQDTYISWDFPEIWNIVDACSYPWLRSIPNPYLIQVPNIVGLSQSHAESLITNTGLTIGIVSEECSGTVPQGKVISQSPEQNIQTLPCDTINFVVSTGPCLVEVPNVVGLTQSEAESVITGLGLAVGTVNEQCSEVEAGKVISQTPEGGTQVTQGSSVNLVVSSGPCPEGEGISEGIQEGEGVTEGSTEGLPEGEGTLEGGLEGMIEGIIEGEGGTEGEGTTEGTVEGEYYPPHNADQNGDWKISLTELLRIIQFFNTGGYHPCPGQSEDNYCPGP